jgi:hypothetical protein
VTCARCGALIGDRDVHLAWHALHDDFEERLAEHEDARDAQAYSGTPYAADGGGTN